VLSVRRDDVRALSSMLHTTENELLDRLTAWQAVVPTAGPLAGDTIAVS
jgi:hypothetical protein